MHYDVGWAAADAGVGSAESVSITVNVNAPLDVGSPHSSPSAFSVSPGGSEPYTDQVYGQTPPELSSPTYAQ